MTKGVSLRRQACGQSGMCVHGGSCAERIGGRRGRSENGVDLFLAQDLLAQHEQRKEWELGHATPAPRLANKAVQPFEAEFLHPPRGTHRHAGNEVEGAANAESYGHRQLGAMAVDPKVLLGVAIGDKQDVGLCATQPGGERWPPGICGLPS